MQRRYPQRLTSGLSLQQRPLASLKLAKDLKAVHQGAACFMEARELFAHLSQRPQQQAQSHEKLQHHLRCEVAPVTRADRINTEGEDGEAAKFQDRSKG